jgi:Domain of unknown function (DUF4251)
MKNVLLLFALVYGLTAEAQSKDSAKIAAVKALVESGNYVFKAQTALPLSGRARVLTSEFDLAVTLPAKIVSNLPYYGRAYSAPLDPSQGGMNFTTKDFDYTVTPGKKGGWAITIKPKDLQDDPRQMYLTISQDGYASLRVINTNRDAISYNGVVASPN